MREVVHAVQAGEPVEQVAEAVRPNSQRKSRGTWAIPQGMGKHEQPFVDMTWMTTTGGKSRSEKSVSQWFAASARAAGVQRSAHGPRDE
jgi:hypothetical protein